ncbi:hypothetical protein ABZ499_16370 [Streptomyces sp. NPDC019990]|uniref:hypothetical protein n=1 Tax=Streptomyces sp. NPDC019990 TaxID=3154693 RepID=UPI0033F41A56
MIRVPDSRGGRLTGAWHPAGGPRSPEPAPPDVVHGVAESTRDHRRVTAEDGRVDPHLTPDRHRTTPVGLARRGGGRPPGREAAA